MALLVGIAAVPAAATFLLMVVVELVQGMEPAGTKKKRRRR